MCKRPPYKTAAATSSAPSARRVENVLSATNATTVVTVHHAIVSVARTPSALQKFATTQLLQTHRHQPKKATTSPVKMGAKADVTVDVVGADVDAARTAASALTKTVSRWTTHKPLWALLNPTPMVTRTPAKRARMRPRLVPIATLQAKAAKSDLATVTAVNVARAKTALTAPTVIAMSPATVTMQRPNKTLHRHPWLQPQWPSTLWRL